MTLRAERKRNLVDEKDIYRQFIDWLNQNWWGLPPAGELLPLIQTCYTPEEAELLTGMPFSGRSLEELGAAKVGRRRRNRNLPSGTPCS